MSGALAASGAKEHAPLGLLSRTTYQIRTPSQKFGYSSQLIKHNASYWSACHAHLFTLWRSGRLERIGIISEPKLRVQQEMELIPALARNSLALEALSDMLAKDQARAG